MMYDFFIKILLMALFVALSGYLIAYAKEVVDFKNLKVSFKSEKVTQALIDSLDYKVFKLGDTRLNIGDEIKVYLKNDQMIKGTVLGAKRKIGALCMVTHSDEIIELKVNSIKKLKIVTKYGRLF